MRSVFDKMNFLSIFGCFPQKMAKYLKYKTPNTKYAIHIISQGSDMQNDNSFRPKYSTYGAFPNKSDPESEQEFCTDRQTRPKC